MIAMILALAFTVAGGIVTAIGRRHGGGATPQPMPVRVPRRRHGSR